MKIEYLVKMANDIGNFFAAEPDHEVAVQGVTEHLRKFWDLRMRRAIITHQQEGGEGLSEVSAAAVTRLAGESKV